MSLKIRLVFFVTFSALLILSLLIFNTSKTSAFCCSNADCGPKICEGAGEGCPDRNQGQCTDYCPSCVPDPTPTPPPGAPPPGGGYQFPTCGGGTVLKCGTPSLFVTSSGLTRDSNLAQCLNKISCGDDYFPSVFTVTGCGNNENKGICQDNCGCCAPGDDYVATQISGTAYNKEIDCRTPQDNPNTRNDDYINCGGDWDDIFISRRVGQGTGECYCDCPDPDGWCGARCQLNGGTIIKNDIVRCRTVTTTWSCQSSCTQQAPSAPTLASPANGAVVSSASVLLDWNAISSWGQACPTATNQYRVRIGTTNPPPLYTSVNQNTTEYQFTGIPGTTYYWQIVSDNGPLTSPSEVRSFAIDNAPPAIAWWQVVDGDVS